MELKKNNELSQEEKIKMVDDAIELMENTQEVDKYCNPDCVLTTFEGKSISKPKKELYPNYHWFKNKVVVPLDIVSLIVERFKSDGYYVWKKTTCLNDVIYYAVTTRDLPASCDSVKC